MSRTERALGTYYPPDSMDSKGLPMRRIVFDLSGIIDELDAVGQRTDLGPLGASWVSDHLRRYHFMDVATDKPIDAKAVAHFRQAHPRYEEALMHQLYGLCYAPTLWCSFRSVHRARLTNKVLTFQLQGQ